MKFQWVWLSSCVLFFLGATGAVAEGSAAEFATVQLNAVRSWQNAEHTRYVLDLSGPTDFLLSPDGTPGEVIVDLPHCVLPEKHAAKIPVRGVVQQIRLLPLASAGGVRLVLDLKTDARPVVFQLKPDAHAGNRLVVDLVEGKETGVAVLRPVLATEPEKNTGKPVPVTEATEAANVGVQILSVTPPAAVAVVKDAVTVEKEKTSLPVPAAVASGAAEGAMSAAVQEPAQTPPAEANISREKSGRDVIVAIDAGHGGQDTGAIGPGHICEKNVTLAIARTLKELMQHTPGLKPELTRSDDYFIPLAERREIARRHYHADIFISIHADASPSAEAQGASVFALSLKGANTATSRFARALADRENSADAVGGIHVTEHDGVLANVLAEMVVEGSLEHSLRLGQEIIQRLDRFSPLHSPHVEQAGFAVLKEPGMVSLLVENGFITNPAEEKHLVAPAYQLQLAKAILGGVVAYCRQFPLPGSRFALQQERSGKVAANDAMDQ